MLHGMTADRTMVLVANRADATGQAPLKDLAGAGGRFDLVARFVAQALLTSHGVREDTDVIVLFTNTLREPKALRIHGGSVKGLRPDERSCASKLNEALVPVAMPVWQQAGDGMESRAITLEALLDEVPGPIVLLDEAGEPAEAAGVDGGTFILGDDQGLTDEQSAVLGKRADATVSLGPVSLQADQAAVVLHNVLDRSGRRR